MTSTTSASSFFLKAFLGSEFGPRNSTIRLPIPKVSNSRELKLNASMQIKSSVNGTTFKINGHEDFTNMIFSEKQYVAFERKLIKNPFENTIGKNFGSGSYLPNSAIFRQHYSVRAYEIGATGKISLETLMNLLQETGINSVKGMGLEVDMMGSTPEMRKRNLVWVATKVQVVIDRYPSCEDIVQIDNWSAAAGKNCMRRDAIIRDCKTGEILVRASSIWVNMNTKTRRVCRIPEEVRAEVGSYLIDVPPIVEDDDKKVVKLDEATAGYVCPDLKPRRSDLDFNQHVNNAKYIGWILESVPRLLLEDHELSRITMEYRRECHKDNMLKSLTTVSGGTGSGGFIDPLEIECFHLLKLESGPEIMKARSEWRPKQANDLVNIV